MSKALTGKVAVVVGATRGAGRGIAIELAEAGATVYCTGRSVRGNLAYKDRAETIEETAELIEARGGMAHWCRVDYHNEDEVKAFFDRLRNEQGKLDILVNDIGGDMGLVEWRTPFWQQTLGRGFKLLDRGVYTHIRASRYGVPLMLENDCGLVVEVTDGDMETNAGYRSVLFYDLAKFLPMRIAMGMAHELRDTGVTALAITPGFLRSEAVLEHFAVTEENWRAGIARDKSLATSETCYYIGRAIVALATDPNVKQKAGQALATWGLAKEYNRRAYAAHSSPHIDVPSNPTRSTPTASRARSNVSTGSLGGPSG